MTLRKSDFRQVAFHDELLLSIPPWNCAPSESRSSAICWASRDLVPRESICMAKLPAPLDFSSSAATPPSAYKLIETIGDALIGLTSSTVPLSSTRRSTFPAADGVVAAFP